MPNVNDRQLLSGVQMNQTFVSPPVCLIKNITYAFQAVWTGVPVGVFTLQSSCDSAEDQINQLPTNYDTISGATWNAGGANGSVTFSYQEVNVPYNWVQFVYTYTSGSGLLISLRFNGK